MKKSNWLKVFVGSTAGASLIASSIITSSCSLNRNDFQIDEIISYTALTAPTTEEQLQPYKDKEGNDKLPNPEDFIMKDYMDLIYDNFHDYMKNLVGVFASIINSSFFGYASDDFLDSYTLELGYGGAKLNDYQNIKTISLDSAYIKISTILGGLQSVKKESKIYNVLENIYNKHVLQDNKKPFADIFSSVEFDIRINVKGLEWSNTNGKFLDNPVRLDSNNEDSTEEIEGILNSGCLQFKDIQLLGSLRFGENKIIDASTNKIGWDLALEIIQELFSASNSGSSLDESFTLTNLGELKLPDGKTLLISPYTLPDFYFRPYLSDLSTLLDDGSNLFHEEWLPSCSNIRDPDGYNTIELLDYGITTATNYDNHNSIRLDIYDAQLFNATTQTFKTNGESLNVKYNFRLNKKDYIQNPKFEFKDVAFATTLKENFNQSFVPEIKITKEVGTNEYYEWVVNVDLSNLNSAEQIVTLLDNESNNWARGFADLTYEIKTDEINNWEVKVPYYIDFCTVYKGQKVSQGKVRTFMTNYIPTGNWSLKLEHINNSAQNFMEEFNEMSLTNKISCFDINDYYDNGFVIANYGQQILSDINLENILLNITAAKSKNNPLYLDFTFNFIEGSMSCYLGLDGNGQLSVRSYNYLTNAPHMQQQFNLE